ncbi:hypothetical protein ACH36K_12035 [Clostridium sp. MB05]
MDIVSFTPDERLDSRAGTKIKGGYFQLFLKLYFGIMKQNN